MKRFLLIGFAVLAIPTLAMVLVSASLVASDKYYWWSAPDLAKAFRSSSTEEVRADPIRSLVGLSTEDAWAQAHAAEFSCLPRQASLECARLVEDLDCSEDWYLVLETSDGEVSKALGTKRATCLQADGSDEETAQ